MKRGGGQVCPDLLCLRAAGVFCISAWFNLQKGDFMGLLQLQVIAKNPLYSSWRAKKKRKKPGLKCWGALDPLQNVEH